MCSHSQDFTSIQLLNNVKSILFQIHFFYSVCNFVLSKLIIMKTLQIIILVLGLFTGCFTETGVFAQDTAGYDVYKEYDNEGNLIYYDSSSFSVFTDTVISDSLFGVWEYGTPNNLRPFQYDFHFPGGPFGYIPEFEFEFVVPDLHDLNEGFEYNFRPNPDDTVGSQFIPPDHEFYHYHFIPPIDMNIDVQQHINEMHKFFNEMRRNFDPYENNEGIESNKNSHDYGHEERDSIKNSEEQEGSEKLKELELKEDIYNSVDI